MSDLITTLTGQKSQFGRSILHVVVLFVILTTIASSSPVYPTRIGKSVAVLSYITFIVIVSIVNEKFRLPHLPFVIFSLIYLIFIINTLRIFTGSIQLPEGYVSLGNPEFHMMYLLTILSYILASFVTVFLIPAFIDRIQIFRYISYISSITILLGIPAYFIGDYQISGVSIITYTSISPLREFGYQIPALASYFGDANSLSKLALAGTFTSAYVYSREPNSRIQIIMMINAIGLFLGNSRSALLGGIAALSIYIVYIKYGNSALRIHTLLFGMMGALSVVLVIISPDFSKFISIGFSGRLTLWRGTIVAIAQNLILGAGAFEPAALIESYVSLESVPGSPPQNSYLWLFVTTGVIGGIAYLGLLVVLVVRYITTINDRSDVILFGLFAALLIVQITDTVHPFGVNKNSVIFGIVLGYVAQDIYSIC